MKVLQLLLVTLIFTLTACGTVGTAVSTDIKTLRGEWKLQNDDINTTGIGEEPVTIRFDIEKENSVGGFAGCNYYGGEYTETGNGGIGFSNLFSTKRACPELSTENQFMELLHSTDRFEVKGNDLYFYQGNLLLLHFEK